MNFDLTELERRRLRQEFVTRSAVVFAVFLVLVTTAGGIWLGVSIRASTDLIEDCTIAGGDCYKRGQQQTAEAIQMLQRIVLASNACANRPGASDPLVLQDCVVNALAVLAAHEPR